MLSRWQKFRRLPWPARKLFLQALCLLPLIGLAIRLFSFRRTQMAFRRALSVGKISRQNSDPRLVQQTSRMVRAAADHGPFHGNCLHQSLALWWLLRRQGIDSELRIGVRKSGARFEAHAWIEWRGRALNQRADVSRRFAAFEKPLLGAPAEIQ
jgi:hypothetical protein